MILQVELVYPKISNSFWGISYDTWGNGFVQALVILITFLITFLLKTLYSWNQARRKRNADQEFILHECEQFLDSIREQILNITAMISQLKNPDSRHDIVLNYELSENSLSDFSKQSISNIFRNKITNSTMRLDAIDHLKQAENYFSVSFELIYSQAKIQADKFIKLEKSSLESLNALFIIFDKILDQKLDSPKSNLQIEIEKLKISFGKNKFRLKDRKLINNFISRLSNIESVTGGEFNTFGLKTSVRQFVGDYEKITQHLSDMVHFLRSHLEVSMNNRARFEKALNTLQNLDKINVLGFDNSERQLKRFRKKYG